MGRNKEKEIVSMQVKGLDKEEYPLMRLKMKDIMSEEEWKVPGLTCLAARPSMGKTALALDIILDAGSWMEKKILLFPLAESRTQVVARLIRMISGFSEEPYMMDMQKLFSVGSYIEKLNLVIADIPIITIQIIETMLQAMKDVGMVVIDYVQFIDGGSKKSKNHKEEVRWIVKELARISEERQIPILILSQLPRDIDKREDKRPQLADMRRDICAEDVDQVIFLYRNDYYEGGGDKEPTAEVSAEIIVAKSKTGTKKTVQAWFSREYLSFWKSKEPESCDDSIEYN